MSNHELTKIYNESLKKITISDKVHADFMNPLFEQLINNDAHIASEVQKISDQMPDTIKAAEAAVIAAETAETNAEHAKVQGDYAKEQADIAAQRTEELNGVDAAQFKDRQDQFSAQLAEKASKSEVQGLVANKAEKTVVDTALSQKRDKNTPIGLNDASPELLSAIEGGDGTSFDLLSIPRDGSVTPEKLDGVKINKNDDLNILKSITYTDELINVSTGVSYPNTVNKTSSYVPVTPNTEYLFTMGVRIVFYDANKVFISSVDELPSSFNGSTRVYTVPPNGHFARFSKAATNIPNIKAYRGNSIPAAQPEGFFRVNNLAAMPLESIYSGNTLLKFENGRLKSYVEKLAGETVKSGELNYVDGVLESITEFNSMTGLRQKTLLKFVNGSLESTSTAFIEGGN